MTEDIETLAGALKQRFGERLTRIIERGNELTVELSPENLLDVARELREGDRFHFELLQDLCGVDYLSYGDDEWDTDDVSSEGFSRGVEGKGPGRFDWDGRPTNTVEKRFAVVVHLLSLRHNQRLRLRVFAPDEGLPVIPSLTGIWASANWFEREAFDLFGILFENHPDLRRILTDYGFVGHPFRKDFPLIGNVEVRYDPARGRVVYEPVSIEPRVLVPRVIRDDSRYLQSRAESALGRDTH